MSLYISYTFSWLCNILDSSMNQVYFDKLSPNNWKSISNIKLSSIQDLKPSEANPFILHKNQMMHEDENNIHGWS